MMPQPTGAVINHSDPNSPEPSPRPILYPGDTGGAGGGGTLAVSEGTQREASTLSGSYAAGGFQIGSDLRGGTEVSYT